MGTDRAQEAVFQAILEQLSYIATHTSVTAERLSTGVMNNVLEVGTRTFAADGTVELSWGTTCGSIEVTNHSTANPVFISSSPKSGTATPGMPQVDFGKSRVINVASRIVTFYGTAGQKVGFQAFTCGALPSVQARS